MFRPGPIKHILYSLPYGMGGINWLFVRVSHDRRPTGRPRVSGPTKDGENVRFTGTAWCALPTKNGRQIGLAKRRPVFILRKNISPPLPPPPRRRGRLSRVPLDRVSFTVLNVNRRQSFPTPHVYESAGSVLPLPRKMTIKKLFETRAQRNVL